MEKRMGIENIHCHHTNGDYVPNNLTKQQIQKQHRDCGWKKDDEAKFFNGSLACNLSSLNQIHYAKEAFMRLINFKDTCWKPGLSG